MQGFVEAKRDGIRRISKTNLITPQYNTKLSNLKLAHSIFIHASNHKCIGEKVELYFIRLTTCRYGLHRNRKPVHLFLGKMKQMDIFSEVIYLSLSENGKLPS